MPHELTLCLLGNFVCIFAVVAFFQNQLAWKQSFRDTIRVPNSLDPNLARHFVGPDLGPNCLQRCSTKDTSKQAIIS